jgi:hypothetical protein
MTIQQMSGLCGMEQKMDAVCQNRDNEDEILVQLSSAGFQGIYSLSPAFSFSSEMDNYIR